MDKDFTEYIEERKTVIVKKTYFDKNDKQNNVYVELRLDFENNVYHILQDSDSCFEFNTSTSFDHQSALLDCTKSAIIYAEQQLKNHEN